MNQKATIYNLIQMYECEWSQYNHVDVEENGFYDYELDDEFFDIDNKECASFLVKVEGKIAGFVLITVGEEEDPKKPDWAIDEFFILPKYRRSGIGKHVFFDVLNKYKGIWVLWSHPKNETAVKFWDKSIDEYTKGNYEHIKDHKAFIYEDGSLGTVFYFNNKNED